MNQSNDEARPPVCDHRGQGVPVDSLLRCICVTPSAGLQPTVLQLCNPRLDAGTCGLWVQGKVLVLLNALPSFFNSDNLRKPSSRLWYHSPTRASDNYETLAGLLCDPCVTLAGLLCDTCVTLAGAHGNSGPSGGPVHGVGHYVRAGEPLACSPPRNVSSQVSAHVCDGVLRAGLPEVRAASVTLVSHSRLSSVTHVSHSRLSSVTHASHIRLSSVTFLRWSSARWAP
eukprot:1196205-Prorocentrum_minimum.AAC.3